MKTAWHEVRCWAQSWTDRPLRMSTEKPEVIAGWHDGDDCGAVPILSRLLLSVIYPSVPVSLFFCSGQCYTLLRSRFSPSLALLLLSPLILSSLVRSHYSSILSILKNLSRSYLHHTLCLSHPHALSFFSSYPHTHSVFIF